MTTYAPAYRMTAFKPRSLSSDESAVLTPVAGAPHSDDFKITTLPNLSGWKPYMGIPVGRNGRLDILNRKLDQGQITVPIQDQRLGTSNLSRWVTAFFGSLGGTPQMLGIKVLMEESLDGGSNWDDYFTGRISSFGLNGSRLITSLVIRDLSSELNTQVFVGRAAASLSYTIEPTVLPLGLASAFGPIPAVTPLSGTFGTDGVYRTITVGSTGLGRADNLVTAAILPALRTGITLKQDVVPNLRVRFTTGGVTEKEAELVYISSATGRSIGQFLQAPLAVSTLWLRPVESSADPYYQDIATGTIANSTACTFTVRQRQLNSPGAPASALILSDVHPVQLWADILDGKFSRLKTDGSVARTFPRNSSAFSTLIADTSFPLQRYVITEPQRMQEWIQKNILHPFGLGCYLNESGEVVPVDLRPPQASPTSTTITNTDLVAKHAPEWSIDRDAAVSVLQVRTYRDTAIPSKSVGSIHALPDPPAGLIETNTADYSVPFFSEATLGVADFGERTHMIDVQGLRAFQGETISGHSREEWIRGRITEMASFFRPLFGAGPQYLTLKCRRTSNTNGVYPGTWRLIDVDEVPGLSSYVRGENRLMLCVESTAVGLTRTLRFLDAGPNTVASQPTVGTPAQESSNTQHGITAAVTLNALTEEAVLWINPTATSVGSRPADSDAGWRQAVPVGTSRPWLASSATYTFHRLPSGKRIWVRVRTDPVFGKKLSSAWAYPSGTGYVDLDALTAPSSPAAGTVTTKAAILTWTVGEALETVVVRKFGATSEAVANAGTPVDFVELPAGTSRLQVDGLDTGGPWWHFDVYHKDVFGGVSSVANLAAFEATGTAATAPKPAGLLVLRSQATNPTPPPVEGIIAVGKPGIQLGIVPAPTAIGLDVELYRAPDSGGSPGTYALRATIPGSQLGGTMYLYNDFLAQDNATYWYKCRHIGNSVTAGAYTADVSAVPGWLNPEVFSVPGEPVLGQTEEIKVQASKFLPNTVLGTITNGVLKPDTTGVTRKYTASLDTLPQGCVITGMILAGGRNAGGDTMQVDLYGSFLGGITTSRATATLAASGASSVEGDAGALSEDAGVINSWFLQLQMNASTSVNDVWCEYARVQFVRTSYRQ